MAITVVFDPPLPTDPPATFDSKAFTLLGDLNDFATEANALQADVNAKQGTATTAAATATTKAAEVSADRIAVQTAAADALAARDLTLTYRDDAQAAAAAAATFDPANYVPKAGGIAMAGPLSVPAGASGAQVPQAQEIGTLADAQLTTHYKRSNVLGTVSQSGGVPTGAIIEQGSNANGSYIRWADGTQICTGVDSTLRTTTVTIGSIFSTGGWAATFAASFSSPPVVIPSFLRDGGSISHLASHSVISTTGATMNGVSGVSNGTGYLRYIAIGRWF